MEVLRCYYAHTTEDISKAPKIGSPVDNANPLVYLKHGS